jgi:hypothetical protein
MRESGCRVSRDCVERTLLDPGWLQSSDNSRPATGGALCLHSEDAAVNADVHRTGVHAREVDVKHVVITGAVEVHRMASGTRTDPGDVPSSCAASLSMSRNGSG